MTTQTVQATETSAMPRVNLMPPEIAEAAKFRQVQAALGAAVVIAIALIGFLYYRAHSGVASAQDQLNQAKADQASLQSQLDGLASVKATFADVQTKQAELASAMGSEVRWSFLLNDLSFRMPSNVWLTSMSVTETPPAAAPVGASLGAAPAAAPDPATTPIGTISFGGMGFKHDDVATWLDALAKEKSFLNPTFSSSAEASVNGRTTVSFSTTVTITATALSNRYVVPPATVTSTGASTS